MSQFSIRGYAEKRVISRKDENGLFQTLEMPGGAALLARILHKMGYSENDYMDEQFKKRYVHAVITNRKDENGELIKEIIETDLGIQDGKSYIKSDVSGNYAIQWGGECKDTEWLRYMHLLWACGPDSELPDKNELMIAEDCLLMIDVSLLRKAGALINKQASSWEQTTAELIWSLEQNIELRHLLMANKILVTFAEDGAVYIQCDNGSIKTVKLVLAHGSEEGYLRAKYKNVNTDYAFTVMTAAAAKHFKTLMSDEELNEKKLSEQDQALQAILRPAKHLMERGYSWDDLQNCSLFNDDCDKEEFKSVFEIPYDLVDELTDPEYRSDALYSGTQDPDYYWCIAGGMEEGCVSDIARKYIDNGIEAIGNLPRLKIGDLVAINRREIEAYQSIRNLIRNYENDNSESPKPLSIAVFGAPGAGKSFGIKQIAKNTLTKTKAQVLEYNVSQFTDIHDLNTAFFTVREAGLEGKIPLVFFNEFDSARDGNKLGWIKSFLMSMEDGKFIDKGVKYLLGKCIFIFASGTAHSYKSFIKPMSLHENYTRKRKFKDIKGPDFVNCLKGKIDVLGPNPIPKRNNGGQKDKSHVLRRAIMLCSLCDSKGYTISHDVLRAMLLIQKYNFGLRSMISILDMCCIESKEADPASLPPISQLSIHVNTDQFLKLVQDEVNRSKQVEKLAELIHEKYANHQIKHEQARVLYGIPWGKPPSEVNESNRAKAHEIAKKLEMIGCYYDTSDFVANELEAFTETEIEKLAQAEHARWLDEKRAAGWKYARIRNDANKQHPSLIFWEGLSDDEKEKYIESVKSIIPLLNSIGLRVYRRNGRKIPSVI